MGINIQEQGPVPGSMYIVYTDTIDTRRVVLGHGIAQVSREDSSLPGCSPTLATAPNSSSSPSSQERTQCCWALPMGTASTSHQQDLSSSHTARIRVFFHLPSSSGPLTHRRATPHCRKLHDKQASCSWEPQSAITYTSCTAGTGTVPREPPTAIAHLLHSQHRHCTHSNHTQPSHTSCTAGTGTVPRETHTAIAHFFHSQHRHCAHWNHTQPSHTPPTQALCHRNHTQPPHTPPTQMSCTLEPPRQTDTHTSHADTQAQCTSAKIRLLPLI